MTSPIHTRAQNKLVDLIKSAYPVILQNVGYPQNTANRIGEIDVIGMLPKFIDFYEVKSQYDEHLMDKAIRQLALARMYWKLSGDDYIYTPQRGIMLWEEIVNELGYNPLKR